MKRNIYKVGKAQKELENAIAFAKAEAIKAAQIEEDKRLLRERVGIDRKLFKANRKAIMFSELYGQSGVLGEAVNKAVTILIDSMAAIDLTVIEERIKAMYSGGYIGLRPRSEVYYGEPLAACEYMEPNVRPHKATYDRMNILNERAKRSSHKPEGRPTKLYRAYSR